MKTQESETFAKKKDLHKYTYDKHHSHYTGKYRGAAHSICSLKTITPKEVTLVLHN